MERLGSALGLTWASVQRRTQKVWTPTGEVTSELAVTYSLQGPPYWELFQLQEGPGPWSGPGPHHVGIWTDDLAEQLDKLAEAGFAQEYAGISEVGGIRGFRYVRDSVGNRIEVLHRATAEPMLNRCLAGGDYA